MSLVNHAKRELDLSGQTAEDPLFSAVIVAAVDAFASYGHSGGSAAVGIQQLTTLLQHRPLSELTSDPDEWLDHMGPTTAGKPLWQNKRDPAVFSKDGGKTWYYTDDRAEESLDDQVKRLADFIMMEIPGEPSQSQGVVDTAIRLLRDRVVLIEAMVPEDWEPYIAPPEQRVVAYVQYVIADAANQRGKQSELLKGLDDLHEWVKENTPRALKKANGNAAVAALSLLRMARDTTSAMIPIVLSQWQHIVRILESAGVPLGNAVPKEPSGLTQQRL